VKNPLEKSYESDMDNGTLIVSYHFMRFEASKEKLYQTYQLVANCTKVKAYIGTSRMQLHEHACMKDWPRLDFFK